MLNSRFAIALDATNLVNISKTYPGIAEYKTFVFKNNYVYSATGANLKATVFNHSIGSNDTPIDASKNKDMIVTISNNIFYNTVNGGNFKHYSLDSATAKYNVFWAVDGTDPGANAKLFGMKAKEAFNNVDVTDNVAYGTLATGRKWVIADGTVDTGMEALVDLTEIGNPIASADTATGTFVMAAGYESYGPQE